MIFLWFLVLGVLFIYLMSHKSTTEQNAWRQTIISAVVITNITLILLFGNL